jgi:hypothetical protein
LFDAFIGQFLRERYALPQEVPPHVRRCLRNLMRELGSKTLQLRQRASVPNPPPPQPLAPEAARPSVLHLTNPRKGPRCHEHRRAGRMSKKTKEVRKAAKKAKKAAKKIEKIERNDDKVDTSGGPPEAPFSTW